MDETVPLWKFSVEGESGLESDERIGAGPGWGPVIEVVAKVTRRRSTMEHKRKIVREADACKTQGTVGRFCDGRNRDLTEALEQQTATSEIRRVISSSPMDAHPTFEAIAAAATTLCAAENAGVFFFDGRLIHFAAHHRWTAEDLDAINVTRREPVPFTDTQVALLEMFARQAVIVIENVRLFRS